MRRRHKAEKAPQIRDVELFGLEPFERCWTIYSYYNFYTAERRKIWGKAYTLPRYEDATQLHKLYKEQKWRYPNPFVLMENPSRFYYTKWDRKLGAFYVIRILPKTYTPNVWVYFDNPLPYNQARRIVNKVKFIALRWAEKCAKEDGFID